MKFITRTRIFLAALLLSVGGIASGQLIYGNTFPFWNVNGPLTVTGQSTLGAVNLTSMVASGALQVTGASTFSGGLVGTTLSVAGATTTIGEVLTATVASGSSVAGATSTTSKNITSVTLTAGDWDVSAMCDYALSGVTATVYSCGFGTTTDTQASQAGGSGIGTDPKTIQSATFGTTITGTYSQAIPSVQVLVPTSTVIYLVANNTYSAGSFGMYGTIRARRMR